MATPDGRGLRLFTELTPDGGCWVVALWPRDCLAMAVPAPDARQPGRAGGSLEDLAQVRP